MYSVLIGEAQGIASKGKTLFSTGREENPFNSLRRIVHQIKMTTVLIHDMWYDGVLPKLVDCLRYVGREDRLRV